MSLPIVGKKAVISGGSRGIGLAIAKRFAQLGVSCVLVGRREQQLADAVAELPSSGGPPGLPSQLSHGFVAGTVSRATTWADVLDKHAKIDILVNAAGVAQESLLSRLDETKITEILNTNLLGATLGCKLVGKQMIKHKGGCIINVSSLLARKGVVGTSVYAASKAGLLGLTTALSVELGLFGVRVNALLPGYIETQMTERLKSDEFLRKIPLRRMGSVEEVADAAAFLAQNTYANNCVLNLDGGLSAA